VAMGFGLASRPLLGLDQVKIITFLISLAIQTLPLGPLRDCSFFFFFGFLIPGVGGCLITNYLGILLIPSAFPWLITPSILHKMYTYSKCIVQRRACTYNSTDAPAANR
jgi:hypothetical protein